MPVDDHYDVLGVGRDASASEIKRAYRKAALEWHPDKNSAPDAEQRFIRIGQAYEVLGNEDSRREYDRYGSSLSTGGARGGGGGFDFARARTMCASHSAPHIAALPASFRNDVGGAARLASRPSVSSCARAAGLMRALARRSRSSGARGCG